MVRARTTLRLYRWWHHGVWIWQQQTLYGETAYDRWNLRHQYHRHFGLHYLYWLDYYHGAVIPTRELCVAG